jgi:hypothetical protein
MLFKGGNMVKFRIIILFFSFFGSLTTVAMENGKQDALMLPKKLDLKHYGLFDRVCTFFGCKPMEGDHHKVCLAIIQRQCFKCKRKDFACKDFIAHFASHAGLALYHCRRGCGKKTSTAGGQWYHENKSCKNKTKVLNESLDTNEQTKIIEILKALGHEPMQQEARQAENDRAVSSSSSSSSSTPQKDESQQTAVEAPSQQARSRMISCPTCKEFCKNLNRHIIADHPELAPFSCAGASKGCLSVFFYERNKKKHESECGFAQTCASQNISVQNPPMQIAAQPPQGSAPQLKSSMEVLEDLVPIFAAEPRQEQSVQAPLIRQVNLPQQPLSLAQQLSLQPDFDLPLSYAAPNTQELQLDQEAAPLFGSQQHIAPFKTEKSGNLVFTHALKRPLDKDTDQEEERPFKRQRVEADDMKNLELVTQDPA